MKTTPYFENSVKIRRDYIKEEWINFLEEDHKSLLYYSIDNEVEILVDKKQD